MDVQQAINLALKQEFAARGIDFATPATATLYVQRSPVDGEKRPREPKHPTTPRG
jgi:hypothetical protein